MTYRNNLGTITKDTENDSTLSVPLCETIEANNEVLSASNNSINDRGGNVNNSMTSTREGNKLLPVTNTCDNDQKLTYSDTNNEIKKNR